MRSIALSSSSVFVDDEMPALKNSVTKVKSSSQTSVSYYSSFSFIKINFEKNLNFKRDHEWISTFFSSVCCSLRFWVVLENPKLPRDHYPQHFLADETPGRVAVRKRESQQHSPVFEIFTFSSLISIYSASSVTGLCFILKLTIPPKKTKKPSW